MIYLDTSLLISALTEESATKRVTTWLNSQSDTPKIVSWWVETEFAAALSMKVNVGAIPGHQRKRVESTFSKLVAESMQIVAVNHAHFEAASELRHAAARVSAPGTRFISPSRPNMAQRFAPWTNGWRQPAWN